MVYPSQKVGAAQVSVDGWISKMWCTHTVECYSVLKRKEILTHAVMWMTLEDIMLTENKLLAKGQILYDSTYMKYLE